MNPLLKEYIETHINDIEKGDLTNSIVCCPLDILSDYLDTLRMVDQVIPGHLIPYTRISCYLASVIKGGHMYNINMRSIGDETYEFQFPSSNIDYLHLRNDLAKCCPSHYVALNLDSDYNNNSLFIKVSIQNPSTFMF